jgi:hypothetical protein
MVINPPGSQGVPAKVIVAIEVTGYYHGNLRTKWGQPGTSTRDSDHSPKRRAMGLYERLLEERAEEEGRRGVPLPSMRGLDSKVMVRRLENSNKRPGYVADLSMMHRLMKRSPRNVGEGMRLGSLKARYRKAYAELRAE